MNWKLLAPLAILGPLMGVLVVMGAFPPGTDRFAWGAIVLSSAFIVARREPDRVVKHGFVIGMWNGSTATLLQAFWVKQMLANNPWMAAKFTQAPTLGLAHAACRDNWPPMQKPTVPTFSPAVSCCASTN